MTPEELASKMRQGTERFRILIIGNANAGKTTILEKVCNAKGRSPEFLDAEGEKVRDLPSKFSSRLRFSPITIDRFRAQIVCRGVYRTKLLLSSALN
jgi:septin family protein